MSQTLGSKIDELYELRERKRELTAELKTVEELMDQLDASIQGDLNGLGLTLGRGTRASVSITETEVPSAVDWDDIYQWMKDNDAPYLLERRLSASAWRELKAAGELVPGTETFVRRKLSVRKV